jgi:hypothetical protein
VRISIHLSSADISSAIMRPMRVAPLGQGLQYAFEEVPHRLRREVLSEVGQRSEG